MEEAKDYSEQSHFVWKSNINIGGGGGGGVTRPIYSIMECLVTLYKGTVATLPKGTLLSM